MLISFIFISTLCSSLFSGIFIEGMVYDPELTVHYEKFGSWFILIQLSYLLNPVILGGVILYKYKKLFGLNKLRYKYIAIGYSCFLLIYELCLVILPMFGIWIFLKQQILAFIPFVGVLLYSSYRYKFTQLSIGLGKIFIYFFSLGLSIIGIIFLKKYFSLIDYRLIGFWGIQEGYSIIDIVLGIIIFYATNKYLSKTFLKSKSLEKFQKSLFRFRESIPFTQTIVGLNNLISKDFKTKLGISRTYIIPNDELEKYPELVHFFETRRQVFLLNDYVFIEENKNKFKKNVLLQELDTHIGIYFPLYGKDSTLDALFCVGKKRFSDFYIAEEINALSDFSRFLQGHLKYISIYSQIHDLNVNLDKKVDEKTLEYNTLINRQKEFIAFISHEIKNPVTNTIFLVDTIKTEVKEYVSKTKDRNVLDDIDILNKELTRISDLTKTIFSVEKHDLHGIKLFKEFVSLYDFLQEHVRSFENQHTNIVFETTMEDVGNIEIDKVQFGQVIDNLIGNATKFVGDNKGKICISMTRSENKKIEIIVEDNGKGFENIDIDTLFDKYSIGESNSTGLGMGLYLCKRIVELHGGSITPSHSSKLGGAKFTIVL